MRTPTRELCSVLAMHSRRYAVAKYQESKSSPAPGSGVRGQGGGLQGSPGSDGAGGALGKAGACLRARGSSGKVGVGPGHGGTG